MTRWLRVAMAVVFLPTGAWAQTSAEYAVMGKKVIAVFIEALRSGKIEKQDVDQVPIGVLIDGPTADFVLGRLWEFDTNYYQMKAYVSEANPKADVASAMRYAKAEFADKNCNLM
jgi:hypothetical protein